MTNKPTKTSNQLLSMVFFLLMSTTALAATNISRNKLSVQVLIKEPFPNRSFYDHPVDDLLADDQFVLSTQSTRPISIPMFGVSIKLIGPNNKTRRECALPPNSKIVLPVRRISYRTVLVQLYNDDLDMELVNLLLINMRNCRYELAYRHPIPVHAIFTSDDPNDDKFTLVTRGWKYCQGHNWCRLTFNPLYRKFEPLEFDLVYDSSVRIEPAGSFDSNHFAVQSTDRSTGTHRIRLYDLSAHRTGQLYHELFALDNYEVISVADLRKFSYRLITQYRLVSSRGLSYCWSSSVTGEPRDVVHCLKFRKDGSLMLNGTINYPNRTEIQFVTTIPNGLVLFGRRSDCKLCSDMQVSVITSDDEVSSEVRIKHHQIDVECGVVKSVATRSNSHDGSIEVYYLCRGENFTYGVFSLV